MRYNRLPWPARPTQKDVTIDCRKHDKVITGFQFFLLSHSFWHEHMAFGG